MSELKWTIKDRTYVLNGRAPLTYKIKSRGFLHFDEHKGVNREIRYAVNQNSLFVDEQDDNYIAGHVLFQDGVLWVPKSQPMLQQLLSVYHPDAGSKWTEIDEVKEARDYVDDFELRLEALNLAKELEPEQLEAILRTELGSTVVTLTSKELRRDAYRMAQTAPELFMELAGDEDIQLRNLANRAVEENILALTEDGTVFKHAKNGKKILVVPFDANPFQALAQHFKTEEGVVLMKSIIKKLSA